MTYLYETKEWEEMVKRVDRQVAEEGGSTGSNMAEPPWVPPGPAKIPEGLSPEEVAERKQCLADLEQGLDEYIAHVKASKQ